MRSRIYDQFGFNPATEDTYQALIDIGRQHMFNPVVDWLNEQKWDGRKRAERLFVDYLGRETALHRAFARKLLCAMVKRVQEPGVKFDFMVILEGPQDVGKSLFCVDLAVRPEWFNDAPVLNRDSKAQMEAVEGKWVIEAAELQGIGKAEVEKVKSFITRTHDRERRAYGRFRAEVGRTCVIIGTTNETAYLKDMTGNRRFWPVAVEKYDQGAFLRDREQIFAEAVTLARTEKLWLDDRKLYAAAIGLKSNAWSLTLTTRSSKNLLAPKSKMKSAPTITKSGNSSGSTRCRRQRPPKRSPTQCASLGGFDARPALPESHHGDLCAMIVPLFR